MTVEPKLLPLRIRLPYATEEDFVEKYGSNVARGGLFIATRSPKPEGTGLAFELVLADGGRLLRGEGVVVKSRAEGPRSGMTVRFVRLDAHSKALIDRIVSRRGSAPEQLLEPAPEAAAPPAPIGAPPVEEPVQAQAARPEAPPKRGRPVISAEALRKQAASAPAPFSPKPAAPVPPRQTQPHAPVAKPAPKPAAPTPQATVTPPAPSTAPAPLEVTLAPEPPTPARAPAAQPVPTTAQQVPAPPPEAPAPTRVPAPVAEKPARPLTPARITLPEPEPARPTTQDLIANAVLEHLDPEELEPSATLTLELEPPARPEIAREVPPVPEEPRRSVSAESKGRRRAILDVPTSTPVTATHPEVVLGIDLGTSLARVAVHHQGTLQLIPLGESQALPSLIAVDPSGQLLVGAAARAEAERSPRHAIHGLRRLLGLRARSPLVRALGAPLPFPLSTGPHGDASVELHGRTLLLPELAAHLLRELKSAASTFLGHEASRAVLCVPAHFDDRQRAAMREAGSLAGLEVLRILNAPSAAALAFGHGRVLARKRILVVELGGGGLDVSVVQLTGDDLEVITTGGDPTVGGLDFDARIAEALVSEREAQGLPRPEHPSDWLPLLTAAEAAKVALSERDEVSFPLPGAPTPFSLNRERLESLTADLVQRITLVVRHVLESSALIPQGLDEVLLLGGQGRSPLVRRRLEESLGVPVRADVDTTHSAALGAALLGQGMLDAAAGKPCASVSEVLSVPIGVAERGGTLRRVLERNTRLPAEKTLVIPVTPGPLSLALFQGPSPVAAENEYLGSLAFTLERPGELEVHFSLSQDGILSLAATLPGVKRHAVSLSTDMPEDAELEALLARSPLEGEPEARPGGLLSGLRKLFGRR
ncbi:TIGR02266 family protein [Archangium sp.]|uniref:TIGR02266 family protein n=1 Tax=Archangium sp. TaxID=1872627 RepID=UPI00389AF23F